ncbi:MAG: ADP-ribosylglycohydrolase family protein [Trueperaceae bacterium]|nr:ADP-ribosylglycohydrolase family protein [Trueperaceae bacterium]
MTRAALLDRAHGMLAGVAVGDALGMPAEFLDPPTIAAWYGRIDGLRRADPRHPHHGLRAGSVTDDTDHTLLLADLVVRDGAVRPPALASALLAWGTSERVRAHRFVGPSTLKTLAALEAGTALAQVPRAGTSNGAAMRVAPLAIAFADRDVLEREVVASCAVSHHTRRAISGAMAMAFALAAALHDGATVDAVAAAAGEGARRGLAHGDWTWTPPIDRRVDHALRWARTLPREALLEHLFVLMGVDMYADENVPDAIALAAAADGDPMEAMAMAANLGGDADTLASMTGALCGGLRGVAAFDDGALAQVERVNGLDLRATARALLAVRGGAMPAPAGDARPEGPA